MSNLNVCQFNKTNSRQGSAVDFIIYKNYWMVPQIYMSIQFAVLTRPFNMHITLVIHCRCIIATLFIWFNYQTNTLKQKYIACQFTFCFTHICSPQDHLYFFECFLKYGTLKNVWFINLLLYMKEFEGTPYFEKHPYIIIVMVIVYKWKDLVGTPWHIQVCRMWIPSRASQSWFLSNIALLKEAPSFWSFDNDLHENPLPSVNTCFGSW